MSAAWIKRPEEIASVLIASLIWDFYEVPKPDEKQMAKINTTKKFDMVT